MKRKHYLVLSAFSILCLWTAAVNAAPATITISDPAPADEGMIGSLNPTLSVTVRHSARKRMTITFSSDASGQRKEISRFTQASSGVYTVRPRTMTRRGMTYHWTVTATDGKVTATRTFSINIAQFIGTRDTLITHSDCWKYGYIKHGWEKGKFFVTTQRGTWAAYDLDKGWYRTYQRLLRRQEYTGAWRSLEDGGNLGHPFWGYWDGQYHALGAFRHGSSGWESASSRTFEGLAQLRYETDVKDLGLRTQQPNWHEGVTYTFSEDRAWIIALDFDATQSPRDADTSWVHHKGRGVVKYWQWTKAGGWEKPVTIGTVSNHTGRVALVRHTRDLWYLFVTEGEHGSLDGKGNANFTSTLKYFKSTDAGATWSDLHDTGVPAHAIWSSVSFARYGDNYYVFLSAGNDSYVQFTTNLEEWVTDGVNRKRVARDAWMKPHGTLLHQSALIMTVAADLDYLDEQYGIIIVVPEMIAHPEPPTGPLPVAGAQLPAGVNEAELSVTVHGPQTYDVAFYWEDGTFIGEDKLLREGERARVTVANLTPGKTYTWYAVARGALLEYYGCEPDTTSDEQWSEASSFRTSK
jgi:hypothetical protein